jgi:hypothetical protein
MTNGDEAIARLEKRVAELEQQVEFLADRVRSIRDRIADELGPAQPDTKPERN